MRGFQRGDEPEILAQNWHEWGLEWETRRSQNHRAVFNWRQVDNQPVNQILIPLLKPQTQNHCSFCDAFPVSPPSIDTIEHFRPKAEFPRDAYRWTNLYFCCVYCQRKNGDFHESAIAPDEINYQFERYFRWDYTTGEVLVNEQATDADQRRAQFTINYFRLNEDHPPLRRRELRKRAQGQVDPLDDFAYRNFVE